MLKKTIVPLIILIVLVVVAFVLKNKSHYATTPKESITNFEPDQATRIELFQKDRKSVV